MAAPMQVQGLQQGRTWTGLVTLPDLPGTLDGMQPARRKRLFKPSMLPPLVSLPPPLTFSDSTMKDMDLYVDFELEIKPFLRDCLVGPPTDLTD